VIELYMLINKVADFALSRLLYTFTLPPFSFETFLYTVPLLFSTILFCLTIHKLNVTSR